MNGVTAVLHKELTNYFQSPIAYFIVAVFLLGTGYFFIDHVFLRGSASMDTTLQSMGVLLITVVPAISMRLFSAEYSGRTIELLMTLPLKKWEIVLGKYLRCINYFFNHDANYLYQSYSISNVRQPRYPEHHIGLRGIHFAGDGVYCDRSIIFLFN